MAGRSSLIIIDPRISFGAPSIKGTPTWIIKGRYDAGGVVERMRRYKLMEDAAEATHDAIAFAKEVLRNEKAPIALRFMAFDRLMNRAYGLPFQAVDISQMIQEQSAQKIIHIVKWLPADPNDKSIEIQHQDD